MKFIPCSACARHVRDGDRTCPFCGVEVSRVDAPRARTVAGHLSRSALLAVSALGAAVAATDCSPSSSIAPYGTPPTLGDAADNSPPPPEDAASEAAPFDGGSLQPMYGLPVLPDAGHD